MRIWASLVCVALAKLLDCDERLCPVDWVPSKQRGDDYCDLACNSAPCGFDSGLSSLVNYVDSDCYLPCSQFMCYEGPYPVPCMNIADFGKGACKKDVAAAECGWDMGMCGYCANNCEL